MTTRASKPLVLNGVKYQCDAKGKWHYAENVEDTSTPPLVIHKRGAFVSAETQAKLDALAARKAAAAASRAARSRQTPSTTVNLRPSPARSTPAPHVNATSSTAPPLNPQQRNRIISQLAMGDPAKKRYVEERMQGINPLTADDLTRYANEYDRYIGSGNSTATQPAAQQQPWIPGPHNATLIAIVACIITGIAGLLVLNLVFGLERSWSMLIAPTVAAPVTWFTHRVVAQS
jgi:hypothetical protein